MAQSEERLKAYGPFKDLMLISVVMKGLPSSFEPFIVNMHSRGDAITLHYFCTCPVRNDQVLKQHLK